MEIVIIWLLFGVVSGIVASNKGRSGCGWFSLGVLLGPFGLILALVVSGDEQKLEQDAVVSGKMKKCPYCAEFIKSEAIVCRYCGKDIIPKDIVPRESPQTSGINCTECGKFISKFEYSYEINGKVICTECNKNLRL